MNCSRKGCQWPATRIIDAQPFCTRHRTATEDAPVARCFCGLPAVKVEGKFQLCGAHTAAHAAAAAAGTD